MPDPFLYERVYDHVLESIRDGTLAPGDRVPSEKELAERFGVSRITSKRALQLLAEAGILDRRRGKGSFVADRPHRLDVSPPSSRPERARRASCLALVLPDASEAYGLDLMCAIEERAAEHGYHLVVRRSRDRQLIEEQAISALVSGGVAAGLIVFPVHGEFYNATLVRLVLDRSPLVLVDRHLPGIPACAVHTDNVAAARALTRYVAERGHERIGFVSPPMENTSSIEERLQGYESALEERGLSTDTRLRFSGLHSTLPGSGTATDARAADRNAVRAFLESDPTMTAFVACEYNIAVLLREVLDELGRDDALIVCFDSPRPASHAFPHIQQDEREMGRRAVDLLVSQLSGREVPLQTLVPFELVTPPHV
ncbi:MAG TPA: GntR family transcriptional regulator [Actinopolymorphaceae bacterium]